MTSYPTPAFRRPALAPGILATIVLLAGVALVGTDGFTWIRYAICILALIVCVFAVQAKHWWWAVALAPVVIAWNPVVPLPFEGWGWRAAQPVAGLVFMAAGVLIKMRNPEDRNAGRR